MIEKKDTYNTINKPTTGLFKDRGSKFLAFAHPIKDEDDAKLIIDDLKKTYHDARHHCYAYRLGRDMDNFRANDDGEPSSSAGKPILNQIDALDLTNVIVVVVRYFGGTLLGVGGLINAYKNATADALSKAQIINKTIDDVYKVEYSYEATNEVLRILNEEKLQQVSAEFNESCHFLVNIPQNSVNRVILKLQKIESVKTEYQKTQ